MMCPEAYTMRPTPYTQKPLHAKELESCSDFSELMQPASQPCITPAALTQCVRDMAGEEPWGFTLTNWMVPQVTGMGYISMEISMIMS